MSTPEQSEGSRSERIAAAEGLEGTLPPIFFALGCEVFQNRKGMTAHRIATAITAQFATAVCAALNTGRGEQERLYDEIAEQVRKLADLEARYATDTASLRAVAESLTAECDSLRRDKEALIAGKVRSGGNRWITDPPSRLPDGAFLIFATADEALAHYHASRTPTPSDAGRATLADGGET